LHPVVNRPANHVGNFAVRPVVQSAVVLCGSQELGPHVFCSNCAGVDVSGYSEGTSIDCVVTAFFFLDTAYTASLVFHCLYDVLPLSGRHVCWVRRYKPVARCCVDTADAGVPLLLFL